MPPSSRYSHQSPSGSPPLSTPTYSVSHATAIGTQKLNIVTRVAIEGSAERGANGAAIKMYMRISLPLDSVTPGTALPLFPEGNLKIMDSQVHPLDANSTPYNFSSTTSPLLHKAARALNLPARSPQSYVGSSSISSEAIPPLDERYTGQILVSSYHVSYILPKEFPRKESDSRSRRPSVMAQFMAAIDIWAPYISQPPHAPYLLSLPVPRCLSNHIRLKIFPPHIPKTSSSLASLSSADEDAGSWDLTSDPHVTRNSSNRLSRTHSFNNFADDESSDASTSAGFADGCGIQGSFPSTDRIRIRWARPLKATQLPQTADGRRRVGIKEVKGNMTCTVLGPSRSQDEDAPEGIAVRLHYEGSCKGVWFPGVATLLGLDVGLDVGDCDVSWVPGMEPKWSVSGGTGFTGYAVGPPPHPSLSRQSSVDNPSIYVLPSSPDARGIVNGLPPARHDSSSSTSSLLRAPLPAQSVPDYSFENSPVSTPLSSLASLPLPSSPENDRRSRASSLNGRYTDGDTDFDDDEDLARPPKVPITIHLNMNDLPSSKHDFKFSVTGTVLVTPRRPVLTSSSRKYESSPNASRQGSDDEDDLEVLVVPRFRVLYSDREHISCTVRNDTQDATLDVFNSVGDIRDAQTRKTVLQRGGHVKCGTDGARIALRPSKRSQSPTPRGRANGLAASRTSRSRPRTPNGMSHRDISPSILRQSFFASALRTPVRRDGPLMIPYVSATITPLLSLGKQEPPKYAVRVNLPAPSDEDMEWLEFGLALPRSQGEDLPAEQPKVEVASASIEGVPVRVVTSAVVKPEAKGNTVPFGEASGKEWITWVKIHIGEAGGGKMDILYLVSGGPAGAPDKSGDAVPALPTVILGALLPSFSIPVGELEVNIPVQTGFDIVSTETNLTHEQVYTQGRKYTHYSMEEFFYPRILLAFRSSTPIQVPVRKSSSWSWPQAVIGLLAITCILLLISLRQTQVQLSAALRSANLISADLATSSLPEEPVHTITITATETPETHASSASARWYYPHAQQEQPQHRPDAHPSPVPVDQTAAPSSSSPPSPISHEGSRPIPTITPIPLDAPDAGNALATLQSFSVLWSLRFELPPMPEIRLPEIANSTLQAMVDSLESAYQLFRKILHYPLPPP